MEDLTPSEDGTIGAWTVSELTRYIRENIFLDPPSSFTSLSVDNLTVHESINVVDGTQDNTDILLVGAVGSPAFVNSWANVGGAYLTARYWADVFGRIHLAGTIHGGATTTVAFTLPPGFRPIADEQFPIPTSAGAGSVLVASTGAVSVTFPVGPTWESLAGIYFRKAG